MRGEHGQEKMAIKNRAKFQTLTLQSSWKILAVYYSCLMLTPSPLPREHPRIVTVPWLWLASCQGWHLLKGFVFLLSITSEQMSQGN